MLSDIFYSLFLYFLFLSHHTTHHITTRPSDYTTNHTTTLQSVTDLSHTHTTYSSNQIITVVSQPQFCSNSIHFEISYPSSHIYLMRVEASCFVDLKFEHFITLHKYTHNYSSHVKTISYSESVYPIPLTYPSNEIITMIS